MGRIGRPYERVRCRLNWSGAVCCPAIETTATDKILNELNISHSSELKYAVVVAHPDDETIGCGGIIQNMENALIIHTTDGAPNCPQFRRYMSKSDYTDIRYNELRDALKYTNIERNNVINLGVSDLEVHLNLDFIINKLVEIIEKHSLAVIFTHAYEGGHPDHDATAFCVAQAALRATKPPLVIEMPFYRMGDDGVAYNEFPDLTQDQIFIPLSEVEEKTKEKMIKSFQSQCIILDKFQLKNEKFPLQPKYDFSKAPNGGKVLYDDDEFGVINRDLLRKFVAVTQDKVETPRFAAIDRIGSDRAWRAPRIFENKFRPKFLERKPPFEHRL